MKSGFILSYFCFPIAISQFEGAAVPHGLTLHLGDLVEITQTCQGKKLFTQLLSG